MLYGFVVGAFLIMNISNNTQMIPFKTMEDCKEAEKYYHSVYKINQDTLNRLIHCVKSGADIS